MRLQVKMWTGEDIPDLEEGHSGATPAWKRTLELNARQRRN